MANISGSKWGSPQLGTSGGVITWSIVGGGEDISRFTDPGSLSVDPDSFLTFDYASVSASAFDAWSIHGDIEFMQIADGGGGAGDTAHADIRIFFGPIPGGTIGYAYYPSSWGSAIAGDMLLDNLTSFNSDQTLFYSLVLHELGHSLGLGHVDEDSIMTPIISTSVLEQSDIDGIQEIYGVQDNAPEVYHLPAGEADLIVLSAPENISIRANDLDNTIIAPEGRQLVFGLAGNDTLNGGAGFDHLDGGDGADSLRGGNHADRLIGGEGNDTLYGDAGNDAMVGNAGDDEMHGGDGRDRMVGITGNDLMFGGAGDDIMRGGSDHDTMQGGDGADVMIGGTGRDLMEGGAGNDLLRGTGGFDTVDGGDGDDTVFGGNQADQVFGGLGNDEVYGGGGSDQVFGGEGDDQVYGSGGFDRIDGGPGNDLLQGDLNADRFIFADGHGQDTITDFEAANNAEKIDFIAISAINVLADLLAHGGAASQVGADVLIDTGGGNSILLLGVSIADLDANDFVFV